MKLGGEESCKYDADYKHNEQRAHRMKLHSTSDMLQHVTTEFSPQQLSNIVAHVKRVKLCN